MTIKSYYRKLAVPLGLASEKFYEWEERNKWKDIRIKENNHGDNSKENNYF